MDPIRSIVVPTDFSSHSRAAAARAVALCRLERASLHLVHAVHFPLVATPYEVTVSVELWEGVRRAARAKLEDERKFVEKSGAETVTAELAESMDSVDAIRETVKTRRAELIVMGSHGHSGFKHAFLGSVAERTLRSVEVPVWVVKEELPKAEEAIQRILLAVDFSADSDRAMDVAAGLAKRLDASVEVLHVVDLPPDYVPVASPFGAELEQKIYATVTDRLEKVRERLLKAGVRAASQWRTGRPPHVIAQSAEELGCQLIVIGSRGNAGIAHLLLGSVAERTIRAARCSVLAVRKARAEKERGLPSLNGPRASLDFATPERAGRVGCGPP